MNGRPPFTGGRKAGAVIGLLLACGAGLSACSGSNNAAEKHTSSSAPHVPTDVLAYVTRIGAGSAAGSGASIVRVDLTTRTVSAPVAVGTFPAALALAGTRLYTADYAAGSITPVSLAGLRPGRRIAAGTGPAGIAVAPGGTFAYVTDAGATPLGHVVIPIALSTGRPSPAIPVGAGPEGIAITPDGRRAYVADSGAVVTGQSGAIGHSVSVVDLTQHKTIATLAVGNAPEAVAVSPTGAVVYVANTNSESISPITTATDLVGSAIGLPGPPQALAFAPGGKTAWVAVASARLPKGGALVPIDVASGQAGAPVPVCAGPSAVALTPDGTTAWVTCPNAGELVPVAVATRRVGAPIPLGGGPYALAITTGPRPSAGPAHHPKG